MRGHDNADVPSPQQLAAYADGELDPATRARIADWLARNADEAADVERQRLADRLCRAVSPPEPSQPAWDAVLQRIDKETQIIRAAQRPAGIDAPRRRLLRSPTLWMGMATAAALLLALLFRPAADPRQPNPAPVLVKAFPAASDGDVEIISLDAGDARTLVVGEPPFAGLVVLAGPGEVFLEKIEPDESDGMMPQKINMNDGSGTPMIVAPLALARP